MTCVETMKLDLISDFLLQLLPKLMESGQISGIRSFQFITITVGVLDQ